MRKHALIAALVLLSAAETPATFAAEPGCSKCRYEAVVPGFTCADESPMLAALSRSSEFQKASIETDGVLLAGHEGQAAFSYDSKAAGRLLFFPAGIDAAGVRREEALYEIGGGADAPTARAIGFANGFYAVPPGEEGFTRVGRPGPKTAAHPNLGPTAKALLAAAPADAGTFAEVVDLDPPAEIVELKPQAPAFEPPVVRVFRILLLNAEAGRRSDDKAVRLDALEDAADTYASVPKEERRGLRSERRKLLADLLTELDGVDAGARWPALAKAVGQVVELPGDADAAARLKKGPRVAAAKPAPKAPAPAEPAPPPKQKPARLELRELTLPLVAKDAVGPAAVPPAEPRDANAWPAFEPPIVRVFRMELANANVGLRSDDRTVRLDSLLGAADTYADMPAEERAKLKPERAKLLADVMAELDAMPSGLGPKAARKWSFLAEAAGDVLEAEDAGAIARLKKGFDDPAVNAAAKSALRSLERPRRRRP